MFSLSDFWGLDVLMHKRKQMGTEDQYLAGAGPGQAEGCMAHELGRELPSFLLGS